MRALPGGAIGILVLAAAVLPAALEAAPQSDQARLARLDRWESVLTGGYVTNGHIGLVKSFWWFGLSRTLGFGLSFDAVTRDIPISLNVAVSAPRGVVRPFVRAGAGTSFSGNGATHYGGGLKVRVGRKLNLVAEYGHYHYRAEEHFSSSNETRKFQADYFGGGINWSY